MGWVRALRLGAQDTKEDAGFSDVVPSVCQGAPRRFHDASKEVTWWCLVSKGVPKGFKGCAKGVVFERGVTCVFKLSSGFAKWLPKGCQGCAKNVPKLCHRRAQVVPSVFSGVANRRAKGLP